MPTGSLIVLPLPSLLVSWLPALDLTPAVMFVSAVNNEVEGLSAGEKQATVVTRPHLRER